MWRNLASVGNAMQAIGHAVAPLVDDDEEGSYDDDEEEEEEEEDRPMEEDDDINSQEHGWKSNHSEAGGKGGFNFVGMLTRALDRNEDDYYEEGSFEGEEEVIDLYPEKDEKGSDTQGTTDTIDVVTQSEAPFQRSSTPPGEDDGWDDIHTTWAKPFEEVREAQQPHRSIKRETGSVSPLIAPRPSLTNSGAVTLDLPEAPSTSDAINNLRTNLPALLVGADKPKIEISVENPTLAVQETFVAPKTLPLPELLNAQEEPPSSTEMPGSVPEVDQNLQSRNDGEHVSPPGDGALSEGTKSQTEAVPPAVAQKTIALADSRSSTTPTTPKSAPQPRERRRSSQGMSLGSKVENAANGHSARRRSSTATLVSLSESRFMAEPPRPGDIEQVDRWETRNASVKRDSEVSVPSVLMNARPSLRQGMISGSLDCYFDDSSLSSASSHNRRKSNGRLSEVSSNPAKLMDGSRRKSLKEEAEDRFRAEPARPATAKSQLDPPPEPRRHASRQTWSEDSGRPMIEQVIAGGTDPSVQPPRNPRRKVSGDQGPTVFDTAPRRGRRLAVHHTHEAGVSPEAEKIIGDTEKTIDEFVTNLLEPRAGKAVQSDTAATSSGEHYSATNYRQSPPNGAHMNLMGDGKRLQQLHTRCKALEARLGDMSKEKEEYEQRLQIEEESREAMLLVFQEKEARLLQAAAEESDQSIKQLQRQSDELVGTLTTKLEDQEHAISSEREEWERRLKEAEDRAVLAEREGRHAVSQYESSSSQTQQRQERSLRMTEDKLAQTLAMLDEREEQIAQLKNMVKSMSSEMNDHREGVREVEDEVDELRHQNEVLQHRLGTSQTECSELHEEVSKLQADTGNLGSLKMELRLLKEDRDRERVKSQSVATSAETSTVQLSTERDTALAELSTLRQQMAAAQADVEISHQDALRAQQASENLQMALESIQGEREAELQLLEEQRRSLEESMAAAHAASLEATHEANEAHTREVHAEGERALLEAKAETRKLEQKLETFRVENVQMRRSLDEAVRRLQSNEEDVIDRTLMKNVLLDWLTKSGSREKRQILDMMSSLLHFTNEEKDRVHVGIEDFSLGKVVANVTAPPPPTRADVDHLEGSNVREKWVNFLLAETDD